MEEIGDAVVRLLDKIYSNEKADPVKDRDQNNEDRDTGRTDLWNNYKALS